MISCLTPRQLYPLARNLGNLRIKYWVGVRAGLNYFDKRKISYPCGVSILGTFPLFCTVVDCRLGRFFYFMYLFWSLDNR